LKEKALDGLLGNYSLDGNYPRFPGLAVLTAARSGKEFIHWHRRSSLTIPGATVRKPRSPAIFVMARKLCRPTRPAGTVPLCAHSPGPETREECDLPLEAGTPQAGQQPRYAGQLARSRIAHSAGSGRSVSRESERAASLTLPANLGSSTGSDGTTVRRCRGGAPPRPPARGWTRPACAGCSTRGRPPSRC